MDISLITVSCPFSKPTRFSFLLLGFLQTSHRNDPFFHTMLLLMLKVVYATVVSTYTSSSIVYSSIITSSTLMYQQFILWYTYYSRTTYVQFQRKPRKKKIFYFFTRAEIDSEAGQLDDKKVFPVPHGAWAENILHPINDESLSRTNTV